jgi:hypothetical protein
MSKITTEDCVAYVVANLATDSELKDWKRLSKSKWYDGVLRQFENRKTGRVVDVFEKGGVITKAAYFDPDADVVDSSPSVPVSPVAEATKEDCLAFLKFSSSNQWTFANKRAEGDDTVWTFVSRSGGGLVMAVEVDGKRAAGWAKAAKEAAANPAPAWTPPYQPTLKDWAAIKVNPVKVDLSKAIVPQPTDPEFEYNEYDADRYKGWSGRIIFDLNLIEDDYDQVSFYCGPEDDGHLDDSGEDGGATDKLKVLFADMNSNIGAAESYHIIPIIKGVTGKEIWKVVRERLLRSGAIESEDNE